MKADSNSNSCPNDTVCNLWLSVVFFPSLHLERVQTAQMAEEVARQAAEMTIRQLAEAQMMRLAMPTCVQAKDSEDELEPE